MFRSVTPFFFALSAPLQMEALTEQLSANGFVPCGPTQRTSMGWVACSPGYGPDLAVQSGGFIAIQAAIQVRKLPASVVKEALEEARKKVEQETGKKPRGKRLKELKEEVELTLLPRAFTKTSHIPAIIDQDSGLLYVGASSMNAAQSVCTLLAQTLSPVPVMTNAAVLDDATLAMAQWLINKEAPAPFELDRECVLKQPDTNGATVRFSKHPLDSESVVQHVQAGKYPSQVALAQADRASFVLMEDLTLKKLAFDVKLEEGEKAADKDDFPGTVFFFGGQLRAVYEQLAQAFKGWSRPNAEQTLQAQGSSVAAAPNPADLQGEPPERSLPATA